MSQTASPPTLLAVPGGEEALRERLARADPETVVNFNVRMRPALHEGLQVLQTRLRLAGARRSRVDLVELALLDLLELPLEEVLARLSAFPGRVAP